jgi:hypothetical protein
VDHLSTAMLQVGEGSGGRLITAWLTATVTC